MNEERELLEAAAKAAGMNVLPEGRWPADAKGWFYNPHGQGGMFSNERPAHWNPLTDDGDALRLAVKLGIGLGFDMQNMTLTAYAQHTADYWDEDVSDSDPYAATRRAIVRAAAEIGRTK